MRELEPRHDLNCAWSDTGSVNRNCDCGLNALHAELALYKKAAEEASHDKAHLEDRRSALHRLRPQWNARHLAEPWRLPESTMTPALPPELRTRIEEITNAVCYDLTRMQSWAFDIAIRAALRAAAAIEWEQELVCADCGSENSIDDSSHSDRLCWCDCNRKIKVHQCVTRAQFEHTRAAFEAEREGRK